MLTMQLIASSLLPTELKFQASAFTTSNATGSVLAPERVMTEVNKANRDIARECNVYRYSRLRADYEITVAAEDFVNGVAEFPFPDYVDRPVALDAVVGNSTNCVPIWYLDSVHPGASVVSAPNYEIVSNVLRIRTYGGYNNLILRYQRTPGALCYGLVTSGTTTSCILNTPTAGQLSTYNDAYKGDFLGIYTTGGNLQVYKITGYTYATRTFTFEAGTAPTTGQNFTILSFLPEQYQDLLVYAAAAQFTEFPERAAYSGSRFRQNMDQFVASIRPPEERSPERPVQVVGAAAIGAPWSSGAREFGYLPPGWPYA